MASSESRITRAGPRRLTREGIPVIGVFVEMDYNGEMDRDRVLNVATDAHPMFVGMPGLQFKFFTLDAAAGRATNFYVWNSRADAEHFLTEDVRRQIAALYGVEPTITYVDIAQIVNNTSTSTRITIDN
jgi:hypothetical protein